MAFLIGEEGKRAMAFSLLDVQFFSNFGRPTSPTCPQHGICSLHSQRMVLAEHLACQHSMRVVHKSFEKELDPCIYVSHETGLLTCI